jgi:hypothetical protein
MARVVQVGAAAYEGSGDFKLIPQGEKVLATVFTIEEVPVASGDNAGKPQLNIAFKVQGGEFNGREIRFQKIPLYDGAAAWKLVTFAKALGLDADEKKGINLPDNIQELLGRSLMIKVSIQKDNKGIDRNQVSGFGPAEGTADGLSAPSAPQWSSLNK